MKYYDIVKAESPKRDRRKNMKIEWTKNMTKRVLVYAAAGVLILLAYFLFANWSKFTGVFVSARKILRPFIMALIFAYFLNGPMMFFESKFGFIDKKKSHPRTKRALAVAAAWISAVAVITLFVIIVLPDIKASVDTLIVNLSGYFSDFKDLVFGLTEKYNIEAAALDYIKDFEITPDGVMKIVNDYGGKFLPQIANIAKYSMQVGSFFADLIIAVIVSIYLMFSKEKLLAQTKKLLYAIMSERTVETIIRVTDESHKTFSGFINGKLIDSLIIGVLCFIGMTIFKFEYSLLISFIVGVTNIIPFFGPIIGAVPSVLLLLMIDPWHALWFAIFVLVLQQLDGNVIGPKILGDSTGLSPLWVMFAIIVGGELFGVVGMFIGVPLFAVLYRFGKEIFENRLQKKNLPTDTEEYKGVVKHVYEPEEDD